MPRDGSGVYHTPAGTDGVPDTTIESSKYNVNVHDVETDLNTPRPIVAGGTGATNADAALLALSGEKAKQVVTNFNTMVWAPGSFYAATTATNSPVTSHAFAGAAYYNDVDNFVVEARDITDPDHKTYYRIQSAGVWGSWIDTTTSADARFVNVAGDTMTGTLTMPSATMTGALTVVTPPVANTDASSKKYVDDSIATLSGSIVTSYVRYDAAQTLTANQQAQARANIAVQKKNYIINGAMMISQENGTTSGATGGYYPVDQFYFNFVGITAGSVGVLQTTSPVTPAGSPNRFRAIVTVADTSVGAGDLVWLQHNMEGLRVADLRFGNAAAKTIIVQFGVKAPAGTYCVSLINSAVNRSYVAEYVITAGEANTDVVKSVVIPGDTTGTWLTDNTIGFSLRWGLMAGTTYQQAAGAWGTANAMGSANQFNLLGTVNNTFELFDVGLYEGTTAPPFVVPDYASELALCKRYYSRDARYGTGFRRTTHLNGVFAVPLVWPVMRANPTIGTIIDGAMRGDAGDWPLGPAQTASVGTIYPSASGDISTCGALVGMVAPTSIATTINQPITVKASLIIDARL